MKAKQRVSEKREQPKPLLAPLDEQKEDNLEQRISEEREQPSPLPAPSNEERKDALAGWQKEIIALAEARLSINEEVDVVFQMLARAIGVCRVIEDLTLSAPDGEQLSFPALRQVMEIVQEDIQVAKWLTSGRPLYRNWY
jgi:excinuclease UvrABC nuclease subunit